MPAICAIPAPLIRWNGNRNFEDEDRYAEDEDDSGGRPQFLADSLISPASHALDHFYTMPENNFTLLNSAFWGIWPESGHFRPHEPIGYAH